ncbi:putative ubiquitin carboxyl-terminal hydrolase 20 [Apostichopus japonicus]|uniref:ubiquitinyl hydrolase 1 n=1 Tax=Stichopus japonicus TaxID=307972 RepID=A0A2G8KA93_STIJA|nr:putative ubiquitin carboxyl-terminal hydrolase 20 [Apostichopus japonicus]
MAANATCPHIGRVQSYYDDAVKERSQGACDSCLAKGPNFWLCLEVHCGYVGCGDQLRITVLSIQRHPVAINLKSRRAWCSKCDKEVFPNAILNRKMEALVKTRKVTEEVHERVFSQEIIRNPRCSSMNRPSPVTEALDEYLQDERNVRGLTGMRNLGNTCYLNAGIQALSNCPPFTHFFLECDNFIFTNKKPYIAQIYKRLVQDVWGRKRPSYLTPNSLVSSFKQACPIFKGYTQQDAQEFLRCFMDRLHEELKEEVHLDGESDEEDDEGSPRSDLAASPEPKRRSRASAADDDTGSLSDGEVPSRRGSRRRSERVQNRHRTISASSVEVRTEGSEDGTPEADQAILEVESGQGDRHPTHVSLSQETVRTRPKEGRGKKRKAVKFSSIVSDVFDGKILSSVQCLTCNTESQCKETFQDLSLPIPGKEDMVRIQGMGNSKQNMVSCSNNADGDGWWAWFASLFTGWSSWLYGPSITLDACLAAFFSADDLKGDNMYSCEKCGM